MASVLIEGVKKPSASINGREMTKEEIEDIECALMTDICRFAESEEDNATGKNGVEGVAEFVEEMARKINLYRSFGGMI